MSLVELNDKCNIGDQNIETLNNDGSNCAAVNSNKNLYIYIITI